MNSQKLNRTTIRLVSSYEYEYDNLNFNFNSFAYPVIMNQPSPKKFKRPKRPLSPYNLFYRYKRGRILQACSEGRNDKETIEQIITTPPGLENLSLVELKALHPEDVYAVSRGHIKRSMKGKLLPFEGKRAHRKTHGTMSFVQMNRVMCDQWMVVDESIKSIFEELAVEGKQLYRQHLSKTKRDVAITSGIPRKDHLIKKQGSIHEETIDITPPLSEIKIASEANQFEMLSSLTDSGPSTPRTGEQEINIVSPIASPSSCNKNHHSKFNCRKEMLDEGDDFCHFIDKNIHLVTTIQDLDSFDVEEDIEIISKWSSSNTPPPYI